MGISIPLQGRYIVEGIPVCYPTCKRSVPVITESTKAIGATAEGHRVRLRCQVAARVNAEIDSLYDHGDIPVILAFTQGLVR